MKQEKEEDTREIEVLDEGLDVDCPGVLSPCCAGPTMPIRAA